MSAANATDTSASKLNEQVQKESFFDTLPESVAKRVFGLKALQNEHHILEQEYHREVLALERKFYERCQPLYAKRVAIIAGETEPTGEQIEAGKKIVEGEEEGALKSSFKPDIIKISGIPEFWLTCFKNHALAEEITERDEEALLHLINIEIVHLADAIGYSLVFTFSENEFFTNKQLTKTFFFKYDEPVGAITVERTTSTEIDWKDGKNLTVTLKARKQRKKGSNETKVVKTLEPTRSFFCFFTSKEPPSCDESHGEELAEFEDALSFDFSIAETIKDKFVPHAVDWYTGQAHAYDGSDVDSDEYDGSEYESDTSDEEEFYEESEEEMDVKAENKEVGPECKQQ